MGKKILMSVLTIFIGLALMFVIIEVMPGDPVDMMAQNIQSSENVQYPLAYERAKAILNYDPDVPLLERFFTYVKGILGGNLGVSMLYHMNVIDLIAGALPWTMLIVSLSMLISFAVGILIGIYIAWTRSKVLNSILIGYQSVFGAIPNYVLGYLLVMVFSVSLGIFPRRGAYSVYTTPGFNPEFIRDVLYYAFLPVLTYFLTTVAGWTLSMKANSLSVLGEDYVAYAQVRGLPKRRILLSYLTKNAILPLVTTLAVHFGLMFGGSTLIENLFSYPGVGYYLSRAISNRDYPLMQGMFLIIIVMVVLSSLFAELLYKQLNPRLRDSR